MFLKKNQLLVILGPTATGKTDLALGLAKRFNWELVSADSRQVYVGLDIGTGKMPGKFSSLKKEDGRWIVDGIAIHMYDVVNPKRQYNVARFVKDAQGVIREIGKKNKVPIIVGGTGLYIKAILGGLPNLIVPINRKLRKELEKQTLNQLQQGLKRVSPESWAKMNNSDRQNTRRLIRYIELSYFKLTYPKAKQKYETLKIGLTAPREILYQRIDERILSRINQGMIREAKDLNKSGLDLKRMKQLGLEYGVLANYLEGQIKDQEELIKILKGKIHGYVRRQLTWFKKEKNINWFDITKLNYSNKIEKLVRSWYDSAKD